MPMSHHTKFTHGLQTHVTDPKLKISLVLNETFIVFNKFNEVFIAFIETSIVFMIGNIRHFHLETCLGRTDIYSPIKGSCLKRRGQHLPEQAKY